MSGRGRRFDAALAEDDGQVAPVADESWEQQYDARQTFGDKALDVAGAFSNGVFQGVGVNPAEVADAVAGRQYGDRLRMQLQAGSQATPYGTGIADFAGETTSQMLSGLGPVAGGVLSGVGNTEGDLQDKAVGGTVGGTLGKVGGMLTGKLSSLLGSGAEAAEREALRRGLIQSGAQRADLDRLDDLGGREYFAEGAQRLGLTGRPARVEGRAGKAIDRIEAERAGLVGQQGPELDPNALQRSIVGVGDRYPGIEPAQSAVDAAGRYAGNITPRNPASGIPWDDVNLQRKYWGDKTNFTSGTPESQVRQGVYGAYNDEMGDALSLRDPGAGDAWRQLGRDEQVAIEMQKIAGGALDRAGQRDFSFTGAAARGLGGLINGPGPARLSALTQRAGAGLMDIAPTGVAAGYAGSEIAESTTDAALNALQNNPQALGPYAGQIAESAGSPEPGAVNALITKLIQTDPEFRTQILPRLRGNQ